MQFYLRAQLATTVIFVASISSAIDFMKPEDCTSKRLDKSPYVASKLPILDQTSNKCVAYLAAQLVDCWRITNDPPVTQLTSPIALAYEYAALSGSDDPNMFYSTEILSNINKLNSCSYDVVKDRFNGKGAADFFFEISMAYKTAQSQPNKIDLATANTLNCMIKYNIPNASQINAAMIKEYLQSVSSVQFINKLLEKVCSNNKIPLNNIPVPPKITKVSDYNNQLEGMAKVRDKINQRLDMKVPQPIGVGFCRDVFFNRDLKSVSDSGKLISGKCKEPHAAMIVGRRILEYKDGAETKKVCQFLIRDSHGSSCNAYKNDPSSNPPEVCENGQVWVDEDALLENTINVVHIGN